jgi:hypothetical protein
MIPAQLVKELDELQQLVAEHTIKHGVHRVITDEIFTERIQHYLGVAKKELEAIGPETIPDDSSYKPMATIFGAQGDESEICVAFGRNEKQRKMFALSEICRITLAQGVIFRNVMTGANMQKIMQQMGLDPDLLDHRNHQKMAYYEERMWKWIEKNYGEPRLAALPPEFRWDGIVVAGFGPKLREQGLVSRYRWENGKLQLEDSPPDYGVHISLIPRWWQ